MADSLSNDAPPRALIVSSVHDYRTGKRGSIQSVADAFASLGYKTTFLSIRFSPLSLIKKDSRAFLWNRANRVEARGGVECYLWRTPWHPFAMKSEFGNSVTAPLHSFYAESSNGEVDKRIREADVIVVESGLGIALLPRMRRLNPRAALCYRGADALDTIGAHPHLQSLLQRHAGMVDHFCLLAEQMAPHFTFARDKTYVVPQGIEAVQYESIGPNPYDTPVNAVSVGSMLFDPSFFTFAAKRFPQIMFHVIGCGTTFDAPHNVRIYPEMAFLETLPYLAHADIGLAPYHDTPNGGYLARSSLKLTQYAYLRRPAVCPHFAVGGRAHRFGYQPGNHGEIEEALKRALADTYAAHDARPMSWTEVAQRLMRPSDFADTAIAAHEFETV
ncbi:hypothetical protein [Terricaulis sp.]|uniref:GumK N-terminal domain-containing glycosyltransferase n=1 Tax=Terricaulis sp. TaxID=2768686 RepID=UPI0037848783